MAGDLRDTYSSPASAVQDEIWRSALGTEYPEGIDPYSYVTQSELDRLVRDLKVGPGDVLVDVGCGRGGAGLYVAAATRASLIGIDIRPLLERTGFEVDAYDEADRWREYAQATNAGLLASIDALAAERGETVEETRGWVQEMAATYETMSRRVFVVASAR